MTIERPAFSFIIDNGVSVLEILGLWLAVLGKALLSLLTQPFFYIALVILLLLFTYRVRMERSMFSVKLSDWKLPMLIVIAAGVLTAIIVSSIAGLLGFSVSVDTIYWLWGITIVLTLFKIRFLSVAYSAGIVILLHTLAGLLSEPNMHPILQSVYESLLAVETTGLLIIVAILHLAEAILVRFQGNNLASPVYVAGKRGKVVGGYVIHAYWPIPLFLFMPVQSTASGAFIFDEAIGHPFFLNLSAEAWLLLACPVMIGVTELSKALTPKEAIKTMSNKLLLLGAGLLLLALATWWYAPLIPLAAILTLLSHEIVGWLSKWREGNLAPMFTAQNNGVKILAIIEQSPAAELGLKSGEILHKVNGQFVQSIEQVFEAMSTNPAFCKLEVLDAAGEMKFVQRARYADEHHQLGIVFAPEENALHYKNYEQPALFTLFRKSKLKGKSHLMASHEESSTATI